MFVSVFLAPLHDVREIASCLTSPSSSIPRLSDRPPYTIVLLPSPLPPRPDTALYKSWVLNDERRCGHLFTTCVVYTYSYIYIYIYIYIYTIECTYLSLRSESLVLARWIVCSVGQPPGPAHHCPRRSQSNRLRDVCVCVCVWCDRNKLAAISCVLGITESIDSSEWVPNFPSLLDAFRLRFNFTRPEFTEVDFKWVISKQVWLWIYKYIYIWVDLVSIAFTFTDQNRTNINIYICSMELKWDGKKLKYDMITRWDEYE